MALKLAKEGWMGSDPKKILKADADIVVSMIYFEGFYSDLMRAYGALNNENS